MILNLLAVLVLLCQATHIFAFQNLYNSPLKRTSANIIKKYEMRPLSSTNNLSPSQDETRRIAIVKNNNQLTHPKLSISLSVISFVCLLFGKVSNAAGKGSAVLRGWGLYGRVPYDDFLFSNDKLLDPNFLRKSFVEAVSLELPIAYKAFRRTRVISEISSVVTRAAITFAGLSILGLLVIFFRNRYSRYQQREIEMMGFTSPTSARYKNRNYNGRLMDSVEGYVDMSRGLNVAEQAEQEKIEEERRQREQEENKKKKKGKRNRDEDEDEDEDEDD